MNLHKFSISLMTLSSFTTFCYAKERPRSDLRNTDQQLLGEWYRCIEDSVDSSVIKSYEETMTFQKDGTVENYYKFFKDDACEEDLTEDDRETLTSEMKDILGEGDELDEMLLAASAEGFSYLASYQTSVTRDGLAALDITYEDDEDEDYEATEYLAYKFVGSELFVSESCDESDVEEGICPKVVGDSPENRSIRFDDVISYEKL